MTGISEYLFCAVNAECGRGSEGGHKAEQVPVPVKETNKQSLQWGVFWFLTAHAHFFVFPVLYLRMALWMLDPDL